MTSRTKTPTSITKAVARFAGKLVPGAQPVWVPVIPAEGALINECFTNVQNVVESEGGARVLGWTIWEWPNTFLEAEFHAVWRTGQSQLHDVTPKQDREDQILFVPDPRATYSGAFVDNPRMALRNDELIDDFILVSTRLFQLTRVGKPGDLVRIERAVLQPVVRHHQSLVEMLRVGARDHDPCFCGSGRKYKKCHALSRKP